MVIFFAITIIYVS